MLSDILKSTNKYIENPSSQYINKILSWCPERVSKLNDLVSPELGYLWSQPSQELLSKVAISPKIHQQFVEMCMSKIDENVFNDSKAMSTILEEFGKENNLNQKTFMKDMRIMICGITVSALNF